MGFKGVSGEIGRLRELLIDFVVVVHGCCVRKVVIEVVFEGCGTV